MNLMMQRLLLLCAGLGFALAACGPPTPQVPKNLLLITLDTLRADHLGAYGYQRPTSPNLDALASQASVFLDVTCSMPTTLPSHVTILTGLPPAQHGATRNGLPPNGDLVSIFDLLAARGFATGALVAAGVLQAEFMPGMGIAEHLFETAKAKTHQVPATAINSAAERWLAAQEGRPFALWLHYYDTHEPYTPGADFAARFTAGYAGPLDNQLRTSWLVSLNQPTVAAELTARDRQHVVDLYDAEIAELDSALGYLFALLRQRHLWEDTLIVIVGDHGQAHGEDDFFGHGEKLLEPVIKVPLMIRRPGQREGRRIETPVETLDLMPTLAALFALPVPAGLPGRSLVPALEGDAMMPRPYRLIARRSYVEQPQRRGLSVHGRHWKLTAYHETDGEHVHLGRASGTGGLDGESFFVPGSTEAARLQRTLEQLEATMAVEETANDPTRVELSEETRKMLHALGYIE